jgi:hypothetical protein
MVFAIIIGLLKLSPSPLPQLDQPAHGSRAANIHGFGRRFKPASIHSRISPDFVVPAFAAAFPIRSARSGGNRKGKMGYTPEPLGRRFRGFSTMGGFRGGFIAYITYH